MTPFEIFSSHHDQVGESPIWDAQGACLWWVDIESKCIRRQSLGGALESWHLSEKVGCIALTADRRVLAAMETGIALLKLQGSGAYVQQSFFSIEHPSSGMRFNDGRCDPSGRMWIGTMVMDMGKGEAAGGFYCLDERGLTGPYIQGLYTPNGLAFSPDGKYMYFSDSHPKAQKIWRCNIDLATGQLSHRQLFVDMTDLPGRPDGAAMDDQGRYWICGNDAGMVHCFDVDGHCLDSMQVPFPKPAMCAFGGPDFQTLFVTSIIPGHKVLDTTGLSGNVLSLKLKHRGLPEPFFSRFPATL